MDQSIRYPSLRIAFLIAAAGLYCCCGGSRAAPPQTAGAEDAASEFTMTRALVPMRDGVALETVVFAPRAATEPLPMLLTRTPYGIPSDARVLDDEWYRALRADGYIFVSQSLRGRFGSQGTFVMDRPPRDRAQPGSFDETTDAFDTIAWLVEHVPGHNGRVGMMGGSYSAWTATLALLDPHPALKVVSEAAAPADQFIGDDMHHNGALRLSYAFEYSVLLNTSKQQNTAFPFDLPDSYDWYLALGPLSNVNERYLHGRAPSWNNLVAHPNRDAFWKRSSLDSHLTHTSIPVLNVAGFWDQEDFYGPQRIYTLLEQHDTEHTNHIVIGPWNHGGWSGPGRTLAAIDFGSDTGRYYREHIQAPWLARWLHDRIADTPEAQVFVSGRNEWESFERWPPEEASPTRLYLQPDQQLTFDPPSTPNTETSAYDEYVSDPNQPVPYVRRPIRPMTEHDSDWSTWQALDQRFIGDRTDVLSWQSDILDRDLEIIGPVFAELFASSSGTDTDWVVKLIDVYPDSTSPELRGYQLQIAGEIVRARFRKSFEHPEPLVPGEVTRYEVPLHSHAHVFLKGHRMMVQVQSSWFPLYDRNPQRFMPSIFDAKASDFAAATQRVFHTKEAASAVVLPLRTR